MRSKDNHQTLNDSGAVMAILAVALIPLLVMLALAIDSLRMSSSHTQHENIANQIALGALQELLDNEDPDEEARLEAAKARAKEIGSLSGNTNIANSLATGFMDTDGSNIAEFETGQWFFAEPVGGCAANANHPCCSAGKFQACYAATNDPNEINAVRIDLKSSQDSDGKFMYSFGNLTGLGSSEFHVSSIAAMVPRNGVFLVDLSRSTQYQTHLPVQRLAAANYYQASEYAFRLANGATCNALPAPEGGTSGGANDCADATNSAIADAALSPSELALRNAMTQQCNLFYPVASDPEGKNATCKTQHCPPIAFPAEHKVFHEFMYPDRTAPGTKPPSIPAAPISNPASATQHYVSDYQCFQINPPSIGGGPAVPEYYMVDTQSDPQPLTTILSGISTSLDEINLRGVPGDRISVFAFDDTVFPTAATVANQLRSFGPMRPGDSQVTELQKLLNGTSGRVAKINAFLFPGSKTNGAGPSRGNTDLPNALLQAGNTLMASPNFSASYNFVALFSDGMVNVDHGENTAIFFNGTTLGKPMEKEPSVTTIGQSTNPAGAFYLAPNANSFYRHLNGLKESTQIIARQSGDAGLPASGNGALDPLGCHNLIPNATAGICNSNMRAYSYSDLGITFHYFAIGNDSLVFSPVLAAGGKCLTGKDLDYVQPYTGALGADNNLFGMVGANIDSMVDSSGTCIAGSTKALCDFLTNNGTVAPSQTNYALANSYLYAYGVHPTAGGYFPIMAPCANPGDPAVDISSACSGGTADSPAMATAIPDVIQTSVNGSISMLVCEVENKTADEQVRAGIESIFGNNTYAVVQ